MKPIKKLGQNFLKDKKVLAKIILAANLSKKDTVLEIGPGMGVLTVELAKRVKKVIAVEKDRALTRILNNESGIMNIKNVKIVQGDILKIHNSLFIIHNSYKIVANLPYYITSPVIRKFLEIDSPPELMVLMVQKEVAQRICAKPGKMSILSVMVQFYADVKIISYVSKKSFWPVPKVDSAIIKIMPRSPTSKKSRSRTSIDADKFFELVKKGFSSRRKMLKNNLGIDIGSNARAQDLSIEQWLKLYKML